MWPFPLAGTSNGFRPLPRIGRSSIMAGFSTGFDKGPRSTESGIIDGTLEARTLEETNRLYQGTPRGGASSPRPLSNEPTLIERGRDVRSNHPLPAQPGIHGSIPSREAWVATSSALSNREHEAQRKQRMLCTSSLGGYTRGCASAPPRIPRTREDKKPRKPRRTPTFAGLNLIPAKARGLLPAKAHHRDDSSAPIQLGVDDHPRARISVSETPTLERVISVSVEARQARACGPSSSQPFRLELAVQTRVGLTGNDARSFQGITAPRNHPRPGEDIGQIHSQHGTVPTTPLTSPASGTPPSSKETLEGGCRGSIRMPHTLDAVNHHKKQGHHPELEGAIPARTVHGMDRTNTREHLADDIQTQGLGSPSPSPTLLVTPYYEQHAIRIKTPVSYYRHQGNASG
nr:unnamed protein product [Digitaria exilis]